MDAVFTLIVTVLAGVWQNILKPALQGVWDVINNSLFPVIKKLTDWMNGQLKTALEFAAISLLPPLRLAFALVSAAVQFLIGRIDAATAALQRLKDNLPAVLTPGSPTPLEMGFRGIADAMQEVNQNMPTFGKVMGRQTAFAGSSAGSFATSTRTNVFHPGSIVVNDRATGQELISMLKRELSYA